jgi:hypothetical protein
MSKKITFYGASRKNGNDNSKMESFLDSVIEHADVLQQIEVLVAIDKDDDVAYFQNLAIRYADRLTIKPIVSEVRHGYLNLHLYYKALFKHAAETTRVLCGFSDDCRIMLKGFDSKILKIDEKYSDNIYFIHTRNTHREKYLGDVTENLYLLYWVQQAKEPASYFPYFSKGVLDAASTFAVANDTKNEWCPVANSWIIDCYIDAISVMMKKIGVDRIHYLHNLAVINHDQVTAPHQRPPHVYGLSPNNLGFIKMLDMNTQRYMHSLAEYIASQTSSYANRELGLRYSKLSTRVKIILYSTYSHIRFKLQTESLVIRRKLSKVKSIILDRK